MAENSCASSHNDLNEISTLLWGPYVRDDVFRRWAQGFHFSKDEPTALVQSEGGPCAVIVPVQAFILRAQLSNTVIGNNWRQADVQTCDKLLIAAACAILSQASTNNRFVIVEIAGGTPKQLTCEREDVEPLIDSTEKHNATEHSIQHAQFHSGLRLVVLDGILEVEAYYSEKINVLRDTFGVLLLLYSVISTKGILEISAEVNDVSEPLIDDTYGYGSQSLINLMLTGRAVGHVWDNDQDVDGLKLRGIDCQGQVGFLTLLEHLRYCEVGSFLKNPRHPIWVLGSETHLTVIFSLDNQLVCPETASEVARRIFRSFDPDGNNFIPTVLLQDLLVRLDLVSDIDYVEIMRKKLDPENLGIILLNSFLDEFFPEGRPKIPDMFTLFHYNGLARSHPDSKVLYQEGSAVILESDVNCVLDSNPMLTCLQTKWPNIDVTWHSKVTPSLN